MQLRRKQALASECRTDKAAAAVRMQVHALGEEERTAAIEEAQALATARRSGESLALAEAVLEARVERMNALRIVANCNALLCRTFSYTPVPSERRWNLRTGPRQTSLWLHDGLSNDLACKD